MNKKGLKSANKDCTSSNKKETKSSVTTRKTDYEFLRMPSIRYQLLAAASLLLLATLAPTPTLARPSDRLLAAADPKEDIPVEELYNELVEEEQKLHEKEVNYIQILGAVAARQLREDELLQQQERRQDRQRAQLNQLVNGGEQQQASLLDEIPVESAASRLAREQQTLPKAVPFQKAKDEKKNNHYMALCHFKLCNMGRKRNTRFLHFWN